MDPKGINRRQQLAHDDTLKRSAIACNRCRSRKTKCAGSPPHPCQSCRDTGSACVYIDPERRINVRESYLQELQARARAREESDCRSADSDAGSAIPPLPDEEWGRAGVGNWVIGHTGQYHFMGNSSSTYIANSLNPSAETLAWHLFPHYQDTRWLRQPAHVLDLPELPPYEMARRLYRAQHAYIGIIFSFLTETEFDHRLCRMYSGPPDLEDREDCLIYCQVLLVLAFGQHYSVNQWISNDGPPGFAYFKAALQYLPPAHEEGSILFVEVLGYVAYYMQTLNRRDAAYLYIGLALRMAISLGLHQEVSGSEFDDLSREQRRRVWWSVYSMERLLSVTSGHPTSIRDEDINLMDPRPVGDEDPHIATVLNSYTQLSRIQGIIGDEVYRKKQPSGSSLSASVQDIMKKLSSWFARLPEDVRLDLSNLDASIRRESVSTYLHYHHCINMTARPLLLYAIQKQMAANAQHAQGARIAMWEDGLSPQFIKVIETAIAAARTSALIFHTAAKYNMVATFGFLDGEQAFSAALLLVMVNIAFPYDEDNASSMDMALMVLQSMAEKGNKYIQACHALLTKIGSSAKTNGPRARVTDPADTSSHRQQQVEQPVEQLVYQSPASDTRFSQSTTLAAGSGPGIGPEVHMPDLGLDGESTLWAEVLDSVGIDMDRQWVETALLGDIN